MSPVESVAAKRQPQRRTRASDPSRSPAIQGADGKPRLRSTAPRPGGIDETAPFECEEVDHGNGRKLCERLPLSGSDPKAMMAVSEAAARKRSSEGLARDDAAGGIDVERRVAGGRRPDSVGDPGSFEVRDDDLGG